uniref:DUF1876 domain-containing protein n=1 Tax=Macrostomum lignano TaxID=282301 RepID=A0A1I8IRQ8_9PLAT
LVFAKCCKCIGGFKHADKLRLPAAATISATAYSMGSCLAKACAMDTLLEAAQRDTPLTLMTDATTKKGRHYSEIQIDTGDSRQVGLSLREVEGGTAAVYAEDMDAALDELVDSYSVLAMADSSAEDRQKLKTSLLL